MTSLSFTQGHIYGNSIISQPDATYALARLKANGEKRLLVQGDIDGFDGEMHNGLP